MDPFKGAVVCRKLLRREQNPIIVAQRAVGVGVQLCVPVRQILGSRALLGSILGSVLRLVYGFGFKIEELRVQGLRGGCLLGSVLRLV